MTKGKLGSKVLYLMDIDTVFSLHSTNLRHLLSAWRWDEKNLIISKIPAVTLSKRVIQNNFKTKSRLKYLNKKMIEVSCN